ncbi:MAG TPA: hypothetical protein VG965_06740 [Patescibacteria group bacterium]|nr:hypothetical protein [Patescibacteria group bacterium]
MLKKLLLNKTLIGFILFLLGVASDASYVMGVGDGSSFLLLIAGIVLVTIGAFLLVKGANSEGKMDFSAPISASSDQTPITGGQGAFSRNSQLVTEWTKTNEMKDKLRILEISANAEAGGEDQSQS